MMASGENPDSGKMGVWFDDGRWRYRCQVTGEFREISTLMRDLGFNAVALAGELGVGERSFRRMIKDSLGIPPGKWLRQQRILEAVRRLREGCSVKMLASELGFRHQGDFCVEFKRWYGVSPSEFARGSSDPSHVAMTDFGQKT